MRGRSWWRALPTESHLRLRPVPIKWGFAGLRSTSIAQRGLGGGPSKPIHGEQCEFIRSFGPWDTLFLDTNRGLVARAVVVPTATSVYVHSQSQTCGSANFCSINNVTKDA